MCGIFAVVCYNKDYDINQLIPNFRRLIPRGPDRENYEIITRENGIRIFLGFQRLSIIDVSDKGLQPFSSGNERILCNGEIYNFRELIKKFNLTNDKPFTNDCEILLPLQQKIGFDNMIKNLDAEFAIVSITENNKIIGTRDPYGVRPLFFGFNKETGIMGFASELKALHGLMPHIYPINPEYKIEIDINDFYNFSQKRIYNHELDLETKNIDFVDYIHDNLRNILINAVKKRLISDRPLGFLLSGGLDSSLVVAIASRLIGSDNVVCFSVGLEGSPDVAAAKKVVSYLGIKNHHIVPFTIEEGLSHLDKVIETIETYDVTTIRASIPQYIMAKYINENTDIRVLMSGEGSDEIHGSYRYFRDAPNKDEFHDETVRLLKELYMFDNLRTDRTMAGNGLEVRVPYLDKEYVQFVKSIDPALWMNSKHIIEKKLLRDAFRGYLPDDILYRSKEAFSDAVSSENENWYMSIIKKANELVNEIGELGLENIHNPPKTNDAKMFRLIFRRIYPGHDFILNHYWLPRFQNEEVYDPSATVLSSY